MRTIAEIEAEIAKLQKEKETILREREAAIERIREAMEHYGITLAEIGSHLRGTKNPVKYQLGDQVWTGRGPMPKWLKEIQDQGTDIETLRVDREQVESAPA